MKNHILLFSDLHLEKPENANHINKISDFVNYKIDRIKNSNLNPILLVPGDVSNGLSSYEFLSTLNCQVFFIPGNHEYWKYDYSNLLVDFRNSPKNVNFINNDFFVLEDSIIIGSTLWTDSGYDLNHDIAIDSASRMNDMVNITDKSWYLDSANLDKLKSIYKCHDITDKIENNKWNFIEEYQENKKSWCFLNDISEVLRFIFLSESYFAVLFDPKEKTSNDSFLFKIREKISHQTQELKFSDFIKNLANVAKSYSLPFEDNYYYNEDIEARELIFNKLKNFSNLSTRKIIIMTHHLPFYEEFLIGRNQYEGKFKLKNNIDPKNFLVSYGREYPVTKYIVKALRGEVPRFNDLTHIVNYSNNGSKILPEFLLSNTYLWVHGHEHHFNYQDFLKGIYFATNPCGLNIRDILKEKNPIEDIPIEVKDKISNKILMDIPSYEKIREIKDSVFVNILKEVNWKELKEHTNKLSQISHKILICAADLVNSSTLENKKKSQLDLTEKLHFLISCYDSIRHSLCNFATEIEVSVSVRLNKDFTIQSYGLNLVKPSNELFKYLIGYDCPSEIDISQSALSITKKSFDAIAIIKFSEKHISSITHALNSEDVNLIKIDSIVPKKSYIQDKLTNSWSDFYSKRFTL